ncbi:hypothetical protein [Pandoraea pulmonicola]|uniref:Uncharacterized protein n=1 Tax=Pandoraea pulmonicola TaxID=93221 RepID=A0AAJ5D120_PANPU|nr:hypothetical protein [Pandoraea pulmonicola]AJC20394.1 hypothetical protein RO07_07760 [Pandoraea pulmonicola]SUA91219.1 Uncharacterised protein [Pandoraea pulmonicola]
MTHKPTLAHAASRAADELRTAGDALRQAHALFAAIAQHESGGAIDIVQLSCIGRELTSTYGERADGEADWLEDVSNA